MIDDRDIQFFCDAAYRCVCEDCDLTQDDASAVRAALLDLLVHCDAEIGSEDESRYTLSLLDMWICFAQPYGVPGGSRGDYCSEAVRAALRQSWGSVTLRADQWVCDTLRDWIEEGALDPERWIGLLESNGVL